MTAIQESVASSRPRARTLDGGPHGERTPVSAIGGPVHPLGGRARVLLSSVFGPYAQDDEYGSRRQNPMELWHNQVTREQGPFSLRMFHRTFGLLLLQANIDAPCTVLDFPSLERFTEELRRERYDVIGIGAIVPNVQKVQKMCELIREHQPGAAVIVGGHVTSLPDLDRRIDADHIVRGDGVRWLRRYLAQPVDAPIRHPRSLSSFWARAAGLTLGSKPKDTAAVLIPSVGCPVGCNFCSTSAMFGGKGRHVSFFETGDELFEVMCDLERHLKVDAFFVLDENFLLYRRRALRLLELVREHQKSWSIRVFSSARVLRSYTMEELVALGISWVWLGIEGRESSYAKLRGIDTRALVRELQANGIQVLGSTILGLEHHTPENLPAAIEDAVQHGTDFHQFMLYMPMPGTPLHAEHARAGDLVSEKECGPADAHGQLRFNYRHPHIPAGDETRILTEAFARDLERNGPSIVRRARTMLAGLRRHRDHPEARVRARFAREAAPLRTSYAGLVWAARRWYRTNARLAASLDALLREVYAEFGWRTRIAAPLLGRVISFTLERERRRLAAGHTYEPQTFYEHNLAARALTA